MWMFLYMSSIIFMKGIDNLLSLLKPYISYLPQCNGNIDPKK